MRKIIKASLFVVLGIVWGTIEPACAKIVSVVSLYDNPKYAAGFHHFAFVNPAAPKQGKITLPAYGSFDNFNPFIFKGIAFSDGADLSLESLGYSPVDDPSSAYPLLAEKFELPADKSYIGFILNPKAEFSNGQPVLADDVIFSFNALREKGAPFYKIYYADVERVEKINPRHVRFYFKKDSQNRELPLILTQFKIFSAADFQGRDFATPTLNPPLGSGAYVIDRFEVGKFVSLKRNPDYWGEDLPVRRGFYNFDIIRFEFYQDTTVTLQALFSGNIDAREEYIAKIWASGYDNKKVVSGDIIKEEIAHNHPATLQFFGFNTRLPKFQDRRVREAVSLAFDFDWANEKLFYRQYQRIYSLFSNSDLAASGLPQGREKSILAALKSPLPDNIFTQPYRLPDNSTPLKQRSNLRRAVELLQATGYDFRDGKMVNLQSGEPLEIEVLSNAANGSTFTRVMLPFIKNLARIGIKMTFRNLEVNVFKNRLDKFDFEMAILSYHISNMPGTEQREFWGSASADTYGSYNLLGIKNPAADAVIDGLINADNSQDYQAYVRALDRIIMNEYYLIPHWYSSFARIAYNKRLSRPRTDVKTGVDIYTWWIGE
ncbi:MAG: ABC transporter substrate-binding protein [Alphaproteobacteria bacterium]|nr:ABC transporter substrate-binding protein [Alphaproteobacteria bacterium]